MTSPLLLAGWLLAVAAASLLLMARRTAHRRTELVVRACHELRGPLQNVMLALGAVEAGRPETARRPPLAALAVELTRASRAVDDLGAATTGRRGRGELRRIDLGPLVRDLVAVHDLAARSRGRRVELVPPTEDGATTVVGDRARLTQAIGNLVQNAVEHGEGTVRVGVARDAGHVHVEVADEGQGLRVPVELLVRGPRRGQRGRGMRIVTEALGDHGGRLRCAPSAQGARLVAELPAHGPRAAT
ncbi:ATP-binding protein [Patulibacter minatonensis]|uniref:ATP-binding protein n=1 Tax=Patulibacter minatonensis TaxID=298163 RepID=UPI00047ADA0A|nr:ATP-binding protein [Patulibacter minatonensis]